MIVCNCMGVSEEDIIKAIKEGKLKTAEEVGAKTGAGTGCGGCIPEIEKILAKVNG